MVVGPIGLIGFVLLCSSLFDCLLVSRVQILFLICIGKQIGFLLSLNIALWGLFDTGDETSSLIFNIGRSSVLAILFSIPYIVDRLIYPKLEVNRILSTFSFPIATTAILFLISLEGPFDGDMISGVYGYGKNLAFKQIDSIKLKLNL